MMQRHLLLLFLSMVLATGCTPTPEKKGSEGTGITGTPLTPLTNTPLRYDGFYRSSMGNTHYALRFFPEGNVVLANGNDTTPDLSEIRAYLVNTVRNGLRPGLYNVPVIQQGDSLYFVTPTERGNIDYRGVAYGTDSVRFYKYSHINAQQAVLTYRFQADGGS